MHNPLTPSNDLDINSSNFDSIETKLRDILGKFIPEQNIEVKQIALYYIRQVTGETINHEGVILRERPEFVYALDIGLSRFPLVELKYRIPTENISDGEYRTIGLGDAHFPDFTRTEVWSAERWEDKKILHPCTVSDLLIGGKPGFTDDEIRDALSPYVQSIHKNGHNYLAKVRAFAESDIAKKIEREIDLISYVVLNVRTRDLSGEWLVNKVL